LGDEILFNEVCDEILHILSDPTTNHNLSMRQWAATEAMLEERLASLDKREKVEEIKKVANAPKQIQSDEK